MSNQKDLLLQHIGQLEGKVVTPELARQCRGLAGVPTDNEAQRVIKMMQGQLLILMLRDLGGKKVYTIDAIDDEPTEFNLTFRQCMYHGKKALEFQLVKKV